MIDHQKERIDKLSKRVHFLEESRNDLQQRIVRMVTASETFNNPITSSEIVQLLFDWVDSDNRREGN